MPYSITLITNAKDDIKYKNIFNEIRRHPKYRRYSESDLVKELIDTPLDRMYRRLFKKGIRRKGAVTKRFKPKND